MSFQRVSPCHLLCGMTLGESEVGWHWFLVSSLNLVRLWWWFIPTMFLHRFLGFFHPYLGKISNFTNIFQMGCNHQTRKVGAFGFPIFKGLFHQNFCHGRWALPWWKVFFFWYVPRQKYPVWDSFGMSLVKVFRRWDFFVTHLKYPLWELTFEDVFPSPKVGYVSPLEGNSIPLWSHVEVWVAWILYSTSRSWELDWRLFWILFNRSIGVPLPLLQHGSLWTCRNPRRRVIFPLMFQWLLNFLGCGYLISGRFTTSMHLWVIGWGWKN